MLDSMVDDTESVTVAFLRAIREERRSGRARAVANRPVTATDALAPGCDRRPVTHDAELCSAICPLR